MNGTVTNCMNWFQEYAFRRLWENNGGTDRVMIKNSHMATRLNAIKQKNVLFITEFQCAFFSFIPQPRSQVWILKNRNLLIDRFLLRGQQLCKFVGTKEIKFFIRKEFNLHGIFSVHQHGRCSIVLTSSESDLLIPMEFPLSDPSRQKPAVETCNLTNDERGGVGGLVMLGILID